ncbi:MAG: TetR/AcrR family transcriptional regulator [Oscillibacter sp.]|jgi:AcrR family transcriptional regulator|nr:TetR/AcrR family transcriptional regulator [Oscillibacter sp.]
MKKEEKTRHTREKILTAAMEEFGTNGYAGASLNNICCRGIAKGLLYHNFESRDALYLACVGETFRALTEYLQKAEIGNSLRRYMDARVEFFRSRPLSAHVFFESVLQPPEALRDEILAQRRDFDALNETLYRAMLDSLSLRSGVTREDAMTYFSMMQTMFNGYFSSPAFRALPLSDCMAVHEKGLSRLLDYMLYGIAERGRGE